MSNTTKTANMLDPNPYIVAALALLLYTIHVAMYRLYLSPISHFPGPKLAALTLWYEFFYDVFPHRGQYTFHLAHLHAKYGPIIRINPWELHIQTPSFYEQLYSSKGKRDKWEWFTNTFGLPGGVAFTVNHDLHRARRGALNPFFSTKSVRRAQGIIEDKMCVLVGRLRGLKGNGDTVRAGVLMSAFSADVVMRYCFGRCYNRLEMPGFGAEEHDALHAATSSAMLIKHFPYILRAVKALPKFIRRRMGKALAQIVQMNEDCREQVKETMAEGKRFNSSHLTVFHELLGSKLPEVEKSVQRLAGEAQTIVAAGTETVAWTLEIILYHLLSNAVVLSKLKEELKAAAPHVEVPISQSELENLPYLTGVIKEGLRLSYGISSRLQRVPHEPLKFHDENKTWIIPAGTPCGMTSLLIHRNESIYPNWREFRPERWIENPRLDRYLVSFTKGSRQCVGMQLVYAELYLCLSGIFRRFGSEMVRFEEDEGSLILVDANPRDVEVVADCLVPNIEAGRAGMRFRVEAKSALTALNGQGALL